MAIRTAALCGSALLLALAGTPVLAATVNLAPETAGLFKAGNGIDAEFRKVDDAWRGSGVLYDPATDQLGVGQPIGKFRGGSGLWGLVDWSTTFLNPQDNMVQASWTGRVLDIAFGDQVFNDLHGATWGNMPLVPLYGPGVALSQDNWAARFSGYIRITEAGLYNFGVLHDDGFFFTLSGAGGAQVAMSNDYLNPRNRMSFADTLQLGVGLYAFELGAYEHLEAGVVELSWARNGSQYTRVPTSHLLSGAEVTPVPEPGTWALLLAGLAAMGAVGRRRGRSS